MEKADNDNFLCLRSIYGIFARREIYLLDARKRNFKLYCMSSVPVPVLHFNGSQDEGHGIDMVLLPTRELLQIMIAIKANVLQVF